MSDVFVRGMRVIRSKHMDDYTSVPRTWKERLFTLPWKPWIRWNKVYSPKALKLKNGTLLVSPASYAKIVGERKR